jgi:hypothetical protein
VRNFLGNLCGKVNAAFACARALAFVAVLTLVTFVTGANATDPIVIDDIADVGGHVTAMGDAVGALAGTYLPIAAALLLIAVGIKWLRKIH